MNIKQKLCCIFSFFVFNSSNFATFVLNFGIFSVLVKLSFRSSQQAVKALVWCIMKISFSLYYYQYNKSCKLCTSAKFHARKPWRGQKLWLGGAQNGKICDVNLVTFFGDVITMTSLKWRQNWFFKFDFVIINLKNHNFVKSRNFKSPKSKIKECWGRRAHSAWRFLKICY